jgi:hypothetical protein
MNLAMWRTTPPNDQDDGRSSPLSHPLHEEPLQIEIRALTKHRSQWQLCHPDEIEKMGQVLVFETCAEAIA